MRTEKFRERFAGKKITVMGLGLLGRGIGDVQFLAECGADLIVTDLKTEAQLADAVAQIQHYPNVHLVLGEHRVEDFEGRDMILKAAGVPLHSPYIMHARDAGVPIEMSAALFAELADIPVIAVTGTRGKSTTAYLIHHVLKEATEGGTVLLGGNVRGVSNLQLLNEVTDESIAVLELDSWQLQGFGETKRSPHIAVFTTFMDDHLNYYNNDRDAYFDDKANIYRYQHAGDTFVTTPAVLIRAQAHAKTWGYMLDQEVTLADETTLPEDIDFPLPGEHNRMNAALAYAALTAVGLTHDEIKPHMESFPGVPGRLERVGVSPERVVVYNDNNATTPDATIAALRALGDAEKKDIVLIMGGADKGLQYDGVIQDCIKYVKHVVLLPGTGTDRIRDDVLRAVRGEAVDTLSDAVAKAFEHATAGNIILFSPSFASFGLFTNEYDRNDQFVALLKQYGIT